MAAFINLAADPTLYNILEASWGTTIPGEDGINRNCFNIFHYHRTAGSTPPIWSEILNSFNSSVSEVIIPHLNVRVLNNGQSIRPLDDPLDPGHFRAGDTATGAVTGDPLSSALAAVVTLDTGVRGRSFRGRKHFSGLSESDSDGGDELKATVITAWAVIVAACAASLADSDGNTFSACVLSPTLSTIFGTPPSFTGADVTECTLNPTLGTMRKRKEKKGT